MTNEEAFEKQRLEYQRRARAATDNGERVYYDLMTAVSVPFNHWVEANATTTDPIDMVMAVLNFGAAESYELLTNLLPEDTKVDLSVVVENFRQALIFHIRHTEPFEAVRFKKPRKS